MSDVWYRNVLEVAADTPPLPPNSTRRIVTIFDDGKHFDFACNLLGRRGWCLVPASVASWTLQAVGPLVPFVEYRYEENQLEYIFLPAWAAVALNQASNLTWPDRYSHHAIFVQPMEEVQETFRSVITEIAPSFEKQCTYLAEALLEGRLSERLRQCAQDWVAYETSVRTEA